MENMNFFQYFVNKSVLTHSSAIKLGINMYQEVILMDSEILNQHLEIIFNYFSLQIYNLGQRT